jgi:hypothetical protein
VGSEDKSTTPAEVKDLADLIKGSVYSCDRRLRAYSLR